MPSTHTSLHYHLVFSTKDRAPFINERFAADLHGYLGGIVRNQGGVPIAIGGIDDHEHLLVGLTASHRIDYFMRELKAGSSGWIRRTHEPLFSWQPGYAAFTVSPGILESVATYINRQREHHSSRDFKREYVELLKQARIDFDERYLW
jgi:REP element-mobilizing transposase RayT